MDKSLRIIFMGTPDFAVPSLKALIDSPYEVVAVVTQPDKVRGRAKGHARQPQPSPVKEIAITAEIPLLQPATDIRSEEFYKGLASYRPDLIVVVAYGRLLPKNILDLPLMGCINVHGSILPKYRGAAPIQWSIINGDQEVGVTIMQMDEGMDTGDILCHTKIKPDSDETSGSLFEKLSILGSGSLLRVIKGLKEGTTIPIPQDDQYASKAPMLRKEDGLIDWEEDGAQIESKIRGFDPWPSAFCFIGGKRLRLFAPEYIKDEQGVAGHILSVDTGLIIACGRGAVRIGEVQPEGKKRMAAIDWLRGARLVAGSSVDGI